MSLNLKKAQFPSFSHTLLLKTIGKAFSWVVIFTSSEPPNEHTGNRSKNIPVSQCLNRPPWTLPQVQRQTKMNQISINQTLTDHKHMSNKQTAMAVHFWDFVVACYTAIMADKPCPFYPYFLTIFITKNKENLTPRHFSHKSGTSHRETHNNSTNIPY